MARRVHTQIRRVVVLVAALAVATTVLAATAGADLEWQPTPTDLSPTDSLGQSPQVSALGPGDAVAVWAETEACECPFFGVNAATWDGATNSWSPSVAIPGQTGLVVAIPTLLADLAVAGSTNGTAVAVWSTIDLNETPDDDTDDFLAIQASTYDGTSWSSATTIGTSGFELLGFPNVDVSIDGAGRAAAVWTSFTDTDIQIQASTNALGTWEAATPISDAGDDVDYARVASLGDGSAVAIWAGCGCDDPILQSSRFNGTSWSAPADVDPVGADDPIAPAITATGTGTAAATWIDFDGVTGNDTVRTATFSAGAWANHTTVSDADRNAASPSIGTNGGGTAVLAWVIEPPLEEESFRTEAVPDFVCSCPGVVQGAMSPGGGTWSTPIDLSDEDDALAPDVSGIGDGAAVAVWFDTEDVRAATFDGTAANGPRTLTTPSTVGVFPQTAGTGAGTAQTVWTGEGGTFGLSSTASLGAPEVLKVASPGGTVTFATSAGGFLHMKNLPLPAAPPQPPGASFPYGLFSFDIVNLTDGQSATLTVTLPAPATEYWKLQHDLWTKVPGVIVNGNTLTFTLTDGGFGDADGLPNGTIVDPGAPGIARAIPELTFTG
jgi:hypothetical protein